VIDADEVHEDRNLDSLEILAEVAQQTHVSSPKVAESSKQKKTIQFSRRKGRQYLAKMSTESSKVSNVDEILVTDAGDTLQDNEPLIDVVAEKVTGGVHTSVDTFFVVGKEYVASPSIDPSVPEQVSHEDTPTTPHTTGSADTITDLDAPDIPADHLEELVIPHDDSADITRV
jgi:hypothetical protein